VAGSGKREKGTPVEQAESSKPTEARPRPQTWARDGFLYLLTFVTLYLVAIGVAILAFGLIEHLFPDRLPEGPVESAAIRYAISQTVVAFPVFLYLSAVIRRKQASGEMPRESGLRKVLTYITLFLIAITAIVDLIVVLYTFLGGDLTVRFALKALSVLAIVAAIFGYYRTDLKTPGAPA
jgi:uncharacterized membrane protein YidH (DUF202 family)